MLSSCLLLSGWCFSSPTVLAFSLVSNYKQGSRRPSLNEFPGPHCATKSPSCYPSSLPPLLTPPCSLRAPGSSVHVASRHSPGCPVSLSAWSSSLPPEAGCPHHMSRPLPVSSSLPLPRPWAPSRRGGVSQPSCLCGACHRCQPCPRSRPRVKRCSGLGCLVSASVGWLSSSRVLATPCPPVGTRPGLGPHIVRRTPAWGKAWSHVPGLGPGLVHVLRRGAPRRGPEAVGVPDLPKVTQ